MTAQARHSQRGGAVTAARRGFGAVVVVRELCMRCDSLRQRLVGMTKRQRALALAAFAKEEEFVVPGSAAACYLRMTPQGVWSAALRGRLRFFRWEGRAYYSWKSVREYRWERSRKFADNAAGMLG